MVICDVGRLVGGRHFDHPECTGGARQVFGVGDLPVPGALGHPGCVGQNLGAGDGYRRTASSSLRSSLTHR